MAFLNHVEVFHRLVSTAPSQLCDKTDAFRVISLRFPLGMASFYYCCWTFLAPWHTSRSEWYLPCLLAYFFPHRTSRQCSPGHLVMRHSSCCYRVWSHIVDLWLHVESPPSILRWRSCVDSPACLSVLFGLYFLVFRTCLKSSLLSGSVLAL